MVELLGGGQLKLQEDGAMVRCEVIRKDDGKGIYKVWLNGTGDGFLLGTLVPEQGALRLCRRVSRDSLARAGCWPVEGGRCVLAFSFQRSGWQREVAECRMTDPVLRKAARNVWALVKEETNGFCLAIPFDTARPFHLSPAFCFAQVERVEGELCAVFCFDNQGQLRLKE